MCGIVGIAAVVGCRPSMADHQVARVRDLMAHRGPDGAGLWRRENVVLGHRRLVVIDPSEAAGQPMVLMGDGRLGVRGVTTGFASADRRSSRACESGGADEPRFVLVYNGELYNDAELRRELAACGARFETWSDTETVLRAWERWGTEALRRLRGIFALAIHDAKLQTLTLARDPLGVKPLYYFVGLREVMFASEPGVLLRHPDAVVAPNPRMVSAYLTTIRTVLGSETLFQGVRAVRAGEMIQCDLSGRTGGGPPVMRAVEYWRGVRVRGDVGAEEAAREVRSVVVDSVRRQLRADVPVCALLSGGLDSTIIAAVARREKADLRTYAAGCPLPCECREDVAASDLSMARRAACAIGTRHEAAHVTREHFGERWSWMVRRMGLPLSTPNEVAIYEVARRLREDKCVVTLSGEGADELFAGYDRVLDEAIGFIESRGSWNARCAALHELSANAWAPPEAKQSLLTPRAWIATDEDRWLEREFEREMVSASEECGEAGLEAHLRFHRRINLTGLLQRLDTATMLAGVEGRTPFADQDVASVAESLPIARKFERESGAGGWAGVLTRTRTKMVLRGAFADEVPGFVMERAKASFPVPFQSWLEDHSSVLERSAFARSIFSDAALAATTQQPGRLWRLAWPMINLSYWGEAMGW